MPPVAVAPQVATQENHVIIALADQRDELVALLARADDMLKFYNSGQFEHFDREKWLADYVRIAGKPSEDPTA